MIIALITLVLCVLCFFAGWILRPARPAEWETIEVDPTGKGPNVDKFHFRIQTDEGPFRFTDYEKGRAKIREPGTHDYRTSL